VEACEAEGQQGGAAPVGKEAEVADADEALGEQMKMPGWIMFRMSLFGGWVHKPGWHGRPTDEWR
jgi:hypothetical protein